MWRDLDEKDVGEDDDDGSMMEKLLGSFSFSLWVLLWPQISESSSGSSRAKLEMRRNEDSKLPELMSPTLLSDELVCGDAQALLSIYLLFSSHRLD